MQNDCTCASFVCRFENHRVDREKLSLPVRHLEIVLVMSNIANQAFAAGALRLEQ
jgi:hypothetical protein